MGHVTTAPARPVPLPLVLLLDAVVLLVFAGVGRREHDSGNPVLGVVDTAWPFLVGAAVGHLLVTLALRRAPATVVAGLVVWVSSIVVGMLLRQATDQGTAGSFIVVASCFTGFFLLGWRLVAGLLRR